MSTSGTLVLTCGSSGSRTARPRRPPRPDRSSRARSRASRSRSPACRSGDSRAAQTTPSRMMQSDLMSTISPVDSSMMWLTRACTRAVRPQYTASSLSKVKPRLRLVWSSVATISSLLLMRTRSPGWRSSFSVGVLPFSSLSDHERVRIAAGDEQSLREVALAERLPEVEDLDHEPLDDLRQLPVLEPADVLVDLTEAQRLRRLRDLGGLAPVERRALVGRRSRPSWPESASRRRTPRPPSSARSGASRRRPRPVRARPPSRT